MKVLVVSYSPDLGQAISTILKVRWPNLGLVHTNKARESLELIHREQPDIVIFHLLERSEEPVLSEADRPILSKAEGPVLSKAEGTPSLDCFDFISQIRRFSDVPLIVISQSDDVMDRVKALETGAETGCRYLLSPWNLLPRSMLFSAAAPLRLTIFALSSMVSCP